MPTTIKRRPSAPGTRRHPLANRSRSTTAHATGTRKPMRSARKPMARRPGTQTTTRTRKQEIARRTVSFRMREDLIKAMATCAFERRQKQKSPWEQQQLAEMAIESLLRKEGYYPQP